MNLSQIMAQLVALVNRRDFTANTALQQTFINQGIMRIQRELRCPAMEKSVQSTIAGGYAGLVIPADFLELIDLYDTTSTSMVKLTKVDLTRALNGAQFTGAPEVYCRHNAMWVLAPAPGIGDVIQIDYYAELAPLVNSTDTNVIATIAWDLIVYAAAVQAAIYYKDIRKQDWDDQYNSVLVDLQEQSDEDDQNSAAQVQPAYLMPLDWEFEHY